MWKTVRSGTGGALGTSLVRDHLARPLDFLPLERLSSTVFVGVMRFVSVILLSVSEPCRGIAEELSTIRLWARVLRSTGTAKDSLTREASIDRHYELPCINMGFQVSFLRGLVPTAGVWAGEPNDL
jgi:hypothetical protein